MAKTIDTARQVQLVALLVKARLKAGLTQAELADRLDQHQSFVARLESGQRRIDVVEFLELADTVGFDPVAILKAVRRVS